MKKLQYECKNCGFKDTLPEKNRNCPKCGSKLNAKAAKQASKPKKGTKKKK